MSDSRSVQNLNRDLAIQINREALQNPQSPYANKFVGIANGQVVVVADDLDTVMRRLKEIEPDDSRCFVVEASHHYGPDPAILALNQEVARQINEEARKDPQSPYANKFVGIANGQVVAVADDLETVSRHLDEIDPDRRKSYIVEASRDYSIPIYV
jgi:tetrahydromethanopterin S-methyltransferase subunit G